AERSSDRNPYDNAYLSSQTITSNEYDIVKGQAVNTESVTTTDTFTNDFVWTYVDINRDGILSGRELVAPVQIADDTLRQTIKTKRNTYDEEARLVSVLGDKRTTSSSVYNNTRSETEEYNCGYILVKGKGIKIWEHETSRDYNGSIDGTYPEESTTFTTNLTINTVDDFGNPANGSREEVFRGDFLAGSPAWGRGQATDFDSNVKLTWSETYNGDITLPRDFSYQSSLDLRFTSSIIMSIAITIPTLFSGATLNILNEVNYNFGDYLGLSDYDAEVSYYFGDMFEGVNEEEALALASSNALNSIDIPIDDLELKSMSVAVSNFEIINNERKITQKREISKSINEDYDLSVDSSGRETRTDTFNNTLTFKHVDYEYVDDWKGMELSRTSHSSGIN
ncbi:hypothetical protein BVX93_00560, partial [bacterium B13(2017)]